MIDDVINITPAAAAGVLGARWAFKLAGEIDKTTMKPGIKHALALVLWAEFGGKLIGQIFSDQTAHSVAKIAALGYAGDLFTRSYLLFDSPWAQSNLYMGEDLTQSAEVAALQGLQETSPLGADSPFVVGPDGTVYQVSGLADAELPEGYQSLISDVSGMQEHSALGAGRRWA